MIITDLVTSKEIVGGNLLNVENRCICIDGALAKGNYIEAIKKAGFTEVQSQNQ